MIPSEHLAVTPPDRFWGDCFSVLLIDIDPETTLGLFQAIAAVPQRIVVYIYSESDLAWALSVADQADVIVMDLRQPGLNDLLKGNLISRHQSCYIGREDTHSVWGNYTADPVAYILKQLSLA